MLPEMKPIEKEASKMMMKDGLADIAVGLFAIFISLSQYVSPLIKYGLIIGAVGLYVYLKKNITYPRIGYVKFAGSREKAFRKMNLKFMMFTVFFVIVVIMSRGGIINLPEEGLSVLAAGVILGITFVLARYLNFKRLYVYGAIFALVEVSFNYVLPILGEPLALLVMFGILGVAITSLGVYNFIRFVRGNERIEADYED